MPIEAASAIGVVASASNALITLCKHGLHFAEIPEEVQQFRHAIDNLQNSIATSKRLRRIKSHYLDSETKTEVDDTIKRSESVLENISQTIEGCRADIQIKGTVSVKNRLDWLLRGHEAFMSRGMTMNTCIQCLGIQIGRMDAMQPPATACISAPPAYKDSLFPEQSLRAPSARRMRVRQRVSSQASLGNVSTFSFHADRADNEPLSDDASISSFNPDQERELPAIPNTNFDAASVFSFDASMSATTLAISDHNCTRDYCTNDFCMDHNAYNDRLTHTQSLGTDFKYNDWSSTTSTLDIPQMSLLGPASIRAPSQRRRYKS